MEEKPKRKPRIPLSPEELYYFIELKKVKQIEKLEEFKATNFYKVFNRINIFLAGLLTYFILSIIIVCSWQNQIISFVECVYGEVKPENNQVTISRIKMRINTGKTFFLKTDYLFIEPEIRQTVFIGSDFIFGKPIKARLSFDKREFWFINTYAILSVCCFALIIGFFIYKVNKHLSVNGLLTVFGLYFLASLYFLLV